MAHGEKGERPPWDSGGTVPTGDLHRAEGSSPWSVGVCHQVLNESCLTPKFNFRCHFGLACPGGLIFPIIALNFCPQLGTRI